MKWDENSILNWLNEQGFSFKKYAEINAFEFKLVDNSSFYYIIEELENNHIVFSALKESERNIPFDLGQFNLSNQDKNVNTWQDFLSEALAIISVFEN